MAVPSVSSAASAASPLERSLLVGAAVGATTPLFMLLPCSISLVPVAMWAGAPGVSAALDLILPGLLNTPIALANFTGATAIALCREGWLHLRRVPLTTALHRHGMLIGGAAGALTPFLAVGWASALITAGVLEPVILAMAVWHELVPWSYTASCTVVTVPVGLGGGAMIATLTAPYFASSASALRAVVVLLGGWAALTAFAGLPMLRGDGRAFVRAIVESARKKDEDGFRTYWWQSRPDPPEENVLNEFMDRLTNDPAITTKWKAYVKSYQRKLERMNDILNAQECGP
jgi:hypothetical protein